MPWEGFTQLKALPQPLSQITGPHHDREVSFLFPWIQVDHQNSIGEYTLSSIEMLSFHELMHNPLLPFTLLIIDMLIQFTRIPFNAEIYAGNLYARHIDPYTCKLFVPFESWYRYLWIARKYCTTNFLGTTLRWCRSNGAAVFVTRLYDIPMPHTNVDYHYPYNQVVNFNVGIKIWNLVPTILFLYFIMLHWTLIDDQIFPCHPSGSLAYELSPQTGKNSYQTNRIAFACRQPWSERVLPKLFSSCICLNTMLFLYGNSV